MSRDVYVSKYPDGERGVTWCGWKVNLFPYNLQPLPPPINKRTK